MHQSQTIPVITNLKQSQFKCWQTTLKSFGSKSHKIWWSLFFFLTKLFSTEKQGLLNKENTLSVVSPLLSYTSEQRTLASSTTRNRQIIRIAYWWKWCYWGRGNNTLSYHTQFLFTLSTDHVRALEDRQVVLPYKFIEQNASLISQLLHSHRRDLWSVVVAAVMCQRTQQVMMMAWWSRR